MIANLKAMIDALDANIDGSLIRTLKQLEKEVSERTMSTSQRRGMTQDGVGAEIFSRIELLEVQVKLLQEAIGELQERIKIPESTHFNNEYYGQSYGMATPGRSRPDRTMTITEFKRLMGQQEPVIAGPVMEDHSIPTVPGAPAQSVEEKHPAHKSSFVLKI